jgi:hypothetical protein
MKYLVSYNKYVYNLYFSWTFKLLYRNLLRFIYNKYAYTLYFSLTFIIQEFNESTM